VDTDLIQMYFQWWI